VASSKADALAANAKAQAGIDQYLSGVTNITLDGVAYTPTSLKAVFQADTSALNDADTAKSQWKQKAQTANTANAATAVVRTGLRAYIMATYGSKAPAMLESFGFTAPKATSGTRSTKIKFQAAERAAETRTLRHTTGKNQKKDIKSTLVVGPIPAPETSSTSESSPVTATVAPATSQAGNGSAPKPPAGG